MHKYPEDKSIISTLDIRHNGNKATIIEHYHRFLAWRANISSSAWKVILEKYQPAQGYWQDTLEKTTARCQCLRLYHSPKSVTKSDSLRRGLRFCLGCVFPILKSLFMKFLYIKTMCWSYLTLCSCPSLKRILKPTSCYRGTNMVFHPFCIHSALSRMTRPVSASSWIGLKALRAKHCLQKNPKQTWSLSPNRHIWSNHHTRR